MEKNSVTKDAAQICPCCGQRKPKPRVAKIYKMMRAFTEIAEASGQGQWVKVPAFRYSGTHAQLKYWGVIEDQVHYNKAGEEKRRSGVWRVTAHGKEWMAGRVTVPAEAIVLLDAVQNFSSTRLTFNEAMECFKDSKRFASIEESRWETEFERERAREERRSLEADDDDDDEWG